MRNHTWSILFGYVIFLKKNFFFHFPNYFLCLTSLYFLFSLFSYPHLFRSWGDFILLHHFYHIILLFLIDKLIGVYQLCLQYLNHTEISFIIYPCLCLIFTYYLFIFKIWIDSPIRRVSQLIVINYYIAIHLYHIVNV